MTWVLIEALKFFLSAMFGAVVCAYFEESRIETLEYKWRDRLYHQLLARHESELFGLVEEDTENDT